jgi:hypothetical protein
MQPVMMNGITNRRKKKPSVAIPDQYQKSSVRKIISHSPKAGKRKNDCKTAVPARLSF